MSGIYELRINITNGASYDGVFPKNPVDGAITISIPHDHANVLAQMIRTNAMVGTPPSAFELRCIEFIREAKNGNMRIIVNFDCCSDVHKCCSSQLYMFSNSSEACMNLIVTSLSEGYHVICSDFSLKALVGMWSEYLPGTCPIVLTGAIHGNVQLIQNLAECRDAKLPQQKPLADLTVPEKSNPLIGISRINCMPDTFRGVFQSKAILDANSEHYKVTLQTIINTDPAAPLDPAVPLDPGVPLDPAVPLDPVVPLDMVDGMSLDEQNIPPKPLCALKPYESFGSHEYVTPLNPNDTKYDLLKIGEYMGYVGQCSVKFTKFSGTLSCSSCHLSNLVETKTDPNLVFECADVMYGRVLSDKMRCEYESMPQELRRTYTDTAVRRMVSGGYSVTGCI